MGRGGGGGDKTLGGLIVSGNRNIRICFICFQKQLQREEGGGGGVETDRQTDRQTEGEGGGGCLLL